MSLDPRTSRPSDRSYVLKLHRSAQPSRGLLLGRIENLATGWCADFLDGEQLLAELARDLASHPLAPMEERHEP